MSAAAVPAARQMPLDNCCFNSLGSTCDNHAAGVLSRRSTSHTSIGATRNAPNITHGRPMKKWNQNLIVRSRSSGKISPIGVQRFAKSKLIRSKPTRAIFHGAPDPPAWNAGRIASSGLVFDARHAGKRLATTAEIDITTTAATSPSHPTARPAENTLL